MARDPQWRDYAVLPDEVDPASQVAWGRKGDKDTVDHNVVQIRLDDTGSLGRKVGWELHLVDARRLVAAGDMLSLFEPLGSAPWAGPFLSERQKGTKSAVA
ncbi:hypothetical protein D3C72_2075190 [compost metagenome]